MMGVHVNCGGGPFCNGSPFCSVSPFVVGVHVVGESVWVVLGVRFSW